VGREEDSWAVRQIVWKEESEGRRVRVGQGSIWMKGVWWMWDEERGELKDGEERSWEKVAEKIERGEKKEEEGRKESAIQGEGGTGMKEGRR